MASGPITSWEIDGETVKTVADFIFLSSKITADGDCSHEIKRHLLLGRKVMTNLDSTLKNRDITLPTEVHLVSSVQLVSRIWLCVSMNRSTPGLPSLTNSQSTPKPMSIESVTPSSHLILCRALLLLPSIFLSIRVFSNESALRIRWPKYWNFSFNISPSNEYAGLISWLDFLAVQGTL